MNSAVHNARFISFYDQKRQNRTKPNYENDCASTSGSDSVRKKNRKFVGKWDSYYPYNKRLADVLQNSIQETEKLGVKCRKNHSCGEFVHRGIARGTSLLDVYSVKITIKDRKKFPGSSFRIHGAIRMIEPFPRGTELDIFFYKVKRDDVTPQYIHLDREGSATLPLSGPIKKLPEVLDPIGISVALKLNDEDIYEPPPSDAPPIIKQDASCVFDGENFVKSSVWHESYYRDAYDYIRSELAWEPYTYGEEADDENPRIPVYVVVDYVVFERAVGAEVHVTILGKGIVKVYGCIRARPCIFDKAIVLFDKEQQTEAVPVQMQSIKLARSQVAVPCNASLLIEAQLYDQCGNLIVDETFFFRPSSTGKFYAAVKAIKFEVQWKLFVF